MIDILILRFLALAKRKHLTAGHVRATTRGATHAPYGAYSSRSPGWQSKASQMAERVEKRMALAFPVFRMERLAGVMPIFSAFMCVTLSFGIGIYWIAGAVVRCIQQVIINRSMMKLDVNEMIAQSQARAEKKAEKKGGVTHANANSTVTRAAHASTRRIEDPRFKDLDKKEVHYEEAARNADPNSITAKANMVRSYDDKKNNRKKR